MIAYKTAIEIASTYKEIENAEELLEKLDKSIAEPDTEILRDCFGRPRNTLELGIPSGESSHRVYNVNPKLARSVIVAHIANKKAYLVEMQERAKIEVNDEHPA